MYATAVPRTLGSGWDLKSASTNSSGSGPELANVEHTRTSRPSSLLYDSQTEAVHTENSSEDKICPDESAVADSDRDIMYCEGSIPCTCQHVPCSVGVSSPERGEACEAECELGQQSGNDDVQDRKGGQQHQRRLVLPWINRSQIPLVSARHTEDQEAVCMYMSRTRLVKPVCPHMYSHLGRRG